MKRLVAIAAIDKRVHAHGLRHAHAAQLRAEGVDIGIISKQFGRASISTTARFLDHLAPRAVIEAMGGDAGMRREVMLKRCCAGAFKARRLNHDAVVDPNQTHVIVMAVR
jgi:hypothetical protein